MAFGLEEFAQRLPDAAAILSQTGAILRVVNRTDEAMEGIEQTWSRLSQPGVYSVTGDEVVFTALKPARTATSGLVETATELSDIMATYADEIDSLKARYMDLKARVDSFDAEHPSREKDDWDHDDDAVAEHNELASESARLLADLDQAQRNAANGLAGISGSGRSYSDTGDGEGIAYGRSAEDRIAGMGGPMEDRDYLLVDWWEWTGRNRDRVWDKGKDLTEGFRDKGRDLTENIWDRIKDGVMPVIPLPGIKQLPDQRNPSGVGRDPNQQPVLGDNDYGDGTWQNKKRNEAGGPYQEYITGVKRPPPGHMTEYIVPYQDGPISKEAEFDGHFWRPGPPPEEVFVEAKGRYAWMTFPSPEDKKAGLDPVRTKLDYTIQQKWILEQMVRQVAALKGNPNARLEWYIADKSVQEELQRQVELNPRLNGKVTVIHVNHP